MFALVTRYALERLGDETLVELVGRHFVDEALAPHGIGERSDTFCERKVRDLVIRGMCEQGMDASLEAHDDADRAPGDLGDDVLACLVRLIEQCERLAPHFAAIVELVEVHAHCCTRATGEFLHPGPLLDGHSSVLGAELEDAVTDSTHRIGDAVELVRLGVCARDEFAAFAAMERRARRGESERSSAECLFREFAHRDDVVRCRDFVRCTAVAHHEGAERTVGDLRPEVDDV